MDRPCLQRASGEEADLTSTSTAAAAKLCGVMDRDIFWSRRSETETEAREGGRFFVSSVNQETQFPRRGKRRTSSPSTATNRLNLSNPSLSLSGFID